jgi:alkaline phosphatase
MTTDRTRRRRRFAIAGTVLMCGALASAGVAGATHSDNGDRTNEVRRAIEGGRAKNVIMFLGDGMGDSEITIARNYAVGAAGRLTMDRLP